MWIGYIENVGKIYINLAWKLAVNLLLIVTLRSGTGEGYTLRHFTVSLDLTSTAGFATDNKLCSGLTKLPLDSKEGRLPNLDALTKMSVLQMFLYFISHALAPHAWDNKNQREMYLIFRELRFITMSDWLIGSWRADCADWNIRKGWRSWRNMNHYYTGNY